MHVHSLPALYTLSRAARFRSSRCKSSQRISCLMAAAAIQNVALAVAPARLDSLDASFARFFRPQEEPQEEDPMTPCQFPPLPPPQHASRMVTAGFRLVTGFRLAKGFRLATGFRFAKGFRLVSGFSLATGFRLATASRWSPCSCRKPEQPRRLTQFEAKSQEDAQAQGQCKGLQQCEPGQLRAWRRTGTSTKFRLQIFAVFRIQKFDSG